jgi:hypothetical protein
MDPKLSRNEQSAHVPAGVKCRVPGRRGQDGAETEKRGKEIRRASGGESEDDGAAEAGRPFFCCRSRITRSSSCLASGVGFSGACLVREFSVLNGAVALLFYLVNSI